MKDAYAKKILAADDKYEMEEEHQNKLYNIFFGMKFEFEQFLDRKGMNEFCELSAFSEKTRKDIESGIYKKE